MTRFAFRQLGLEKVYAGVAEGNDRALRAARRAGYEVEAALERHHVQDDRLATEYWLAAYRDHPLYLAG
jgi:RimJ/RimL family protein N-acetyltransferase